MIWLPGALIIGFVLGWWLGRKLAFAWFAGELEQLLAILRRDQER